MSKAPPPWLLKRSPNELMGCVMKRTHGLCHVVFPSDTPLPELWWREFRVCVRFLLDALKQIKKQYVWRTAHNHERENELLGFDDAFESIAVGKKCFATGGRVMSHDEIQNK